jgi:hypothetical protein
MTRPAAERLHIPPGQHYDCVQCGRGCTDFWEIPVDEESERRLQRHDLAAHQQRAHGQTPFVDSAFDKGGRALRRVGDFCTFLCDDRTCALHAALGPKEKPQVCIDFPYRFVDTPGGTFAGVTFACTAVRRNSGRLLVEKRDELAENYRERVHVSRTAARPRLTARLEITFEAAAELERALDDILAQPRHPLPLRLLAQSILIDLTTRAFETARAMPGAAVPLTDEERRVAGTASDVELVAALAERFRRDNWGPLLLMAQRRKPAPMVHRAFVGLVTTFRQALWRDATRARALMTLLRHYTLHAAGAAGIRLLPLERRFHYADFRTRRADLTPGSFADELLTRYFRHVLFRKDLLLAETIRAGHRFTLLHFALVRWYLTGLMAERGETVASDETVEEALLNVEKYYVLHTTFTKFLERQPVLATAVDAAIHTARFPAAMVHPPA